MAHPFLAAALLLAPAHAAWDLHPPDDDHPCERELLDDEEAFERNAWAHACGYIPEGALILMFVHDLWVAFEAPGAPLDGNLPCAHAWGEPVTLCPAHVD